MAKSQNPFEFKTGGGLLKKVMGVLIGLAVLCLVVKSPAEAAAFVTGVFRLIGQVIDGISAFLGQVTK